MLFDFDRFAITAKLAYRRCTKSAYSVEDVYLFSGTISRLTNSSGIAYTP